MCIMQYVAIRIFNINVVMYRVQIKLNTVRWIIIDNCLMLYITDLIYVARLESQQ